MRIKNQQMRRQQLGNPFANESISERRKRKGTTDFRDNKEIIDHGNGYWTFKAIDPSKKYN
ncbi:hypothetical protein [Ferdinandcohnia sp. SAFN-114]|uniref:hypothetical protein n=1 Tax=Ferdinandcohnia sp. SAFN-114 TaxID=3387275 RepID=UPI003F7F4D86